MTSMTEPTHQASTNTTNPDAPATGLDPIEAALQDLWHQAGDATNSADFRNPPFEKCSECDTALGELDEDAYQRYQRNAIEKAAKVIRQAVAETIAKRIETRPDAAYSMTTQPDHLSRSVDAGIAREVGQ